MAVRNGAASAAMLLLASGCGGDGGSGSGGVTIPPASVAPTPTPTSTPTPSVSPTPNATYRTFDDPLADWHAAASYAFTEYVRKKPNSASTEDFVRMVSDMQVAIVQADFTGKPTIFAYYSDLMRGKFITFAEKDLAYNMEEIGLGLVRYMDDGGTAMLGIEYPRFSINPKESYKFKYSAYPWVRYEYRNGGTAQYTTLSYHFILGDKTAGSDVPRFEGPGSRPEYVYSAFLIQPFPEPGNPNFPLRANGNLMFSSIDRSFSGWIQYSDRTSTDGTTTSRLNLTGALDTQTQQISGTISSSTGVYTGAFQGSFYGPNAKEVGLFFTLRNKAGTYSTSGVIRGAWIVCANHANGVILNEIVCS